MSADRHRPTGGIIDGATAESRQFDIFRESFALPFRTN